MWQAGWHHHGRHHVPQEDGFPSDNYEFEEGVLEGPRWVAEGVAADAAWVASKASEAVATVVMRL